MKRQRSQSSMAISSRRKKPRLQRQDATVAAVVRKELRKKTDWKYTDVSSAAASVSSTGFVTSLLSSLVRGDTGLNAFDGNIINPQAITLKYFAHTSEIRNCLRVMIIQWFDASAPVISGVIQNGSTGIACVAPTNITNKAYIKVLYDRTHQMSPQAPSGVGEGIIEPVTVYIPGKRLRPIRYNATTNVVQEGQLYILCVSDDALTPSPQITYYSRVTFSDN